MGAGCELPVHDDAGGAARGIERQHRLDGHVHCWDLSSQVRQGVEGFWVALLVRNDDDDDDDDDDSNNA